MAPQKSVCVVRVGASSAAGAAAGVGARRLVLNGLTAEVRPAGVAGVAGVAARPHRRREFYHELELYRQLLALPPDTSPAPSPDSTPPTSPPAGGSPARAPAAPAAPPAPPASAAHAHPDPAIATECGGGGGGAARVVVVVARAGVSVRGPQEQEQAQELNRLVGDAFRMAFASQLHPSAPLWSKEVGAECVGGGGGVRAPASLPGLAPAYPRPFGTSACVSSTALGGWGSSASPSSSEESASPPAGCAYRRLGERAPLVRRLARGLGAAGAVGAGGGALLPSDDDSTPLVADTPTTPTDVSVCLNGGYMNEAAEAAARDRDTRHSNREPPLPPPPVPALPTADADFNKCTNFLNNCVPSVGACDGACADACACLCSRTGTGSSSSGNSYGAHNNNPRAEPELAHAPWFQQGIPREIALEVLSGLPVGAFLVRGSSTQPSCLALSVRVPRECAPRGIAHYLILRTTKGYKIKGFTKEFTSLSALVTHHSVMPELLPVPLRLSRAPAPARADLADIDAVAPRLPGPPHPHPSPPSQRASPRRAHVHSRHSTPHHVASFLTQLDV